MAAPGASPWAGAFSRVAPAAAQRVTQQPFSASPRRQGRQQQQQQQQQLPRPRSRRAPPLHAFMPSLDVPSLVPGWLWSDRDARPAEAKRRQRAGQLRQLLSESRRASVVPLPLPPEDPAPDDAGISVAHSASNAVPFVAGGPAGGGGAAPTCSSLSLAPGAPAGSCRAEEARPVLPWLFAVEGRLDLSAMEALASQLALGGLQLLDVSRYQAASSAAPGNHWHASWGSHVRWAGPQALPSPAVAAAAALRRMELRRGGALHPMPEIEGKAVVLAFHPQQRQLAAETLALYLHAYHGISGREAVEAAGSAIGASPVQATLRQGLEELALIADGWYRRVTLAWPYAGGHVEIVGDAVGGWDAHHRAPMVFDVKRKCWKLQIWGLQPGIHRFKYLVDGCWVIDLAAHTEADSRGNINNVVMVTNAGKPLMRAASDQGAADSSSDEEEGAGAGASGASGAMPTAEPTPTDTAGGDAAGGDEAAPPPKPWSSEEELVALARFGAAVLAFHTRLRLQLRHAMN